MATKTTLAPATAQLLVSISDLSMLNDIKKAISMLKGVTTVKVVSKREKSQACLSSSEREQAQAQLKVQKPAKQKTRIYDPETGEYMNDRAVRDIEQALDDAKHGRLTTYNSVDEFFKEMGL